MSESISPTTSANKDARNAILAKRKNIIQNGGVAAADNNRGEFEGVQDGTNKENPAVQPVSLKNKTSLPAKVTPHMSKSQSDENMSPLVPVRLSDAYPLILREEDDDTLSVVVQVGEPPLSAREDRVDVPSTQPDSANKKSVHWPSKMENVHDIAPGEPVVEPSDGFLGLSESSCNVFKLFSVTSSGSGSSSSASPISPTKSPVRFDPPEDRRDSSSRPQSSSTR